MTQMLVQNGAVIAYVLVGLVALLGLGVIQLIRRRGDVKRARVAVRLASHSISELRQGPIAVRGTYHASNAERWLACSGQRVELVGEVDVVRGTSARWQRGARSYAVRDGNEVIAIGVMSKAGAGWRLAASAGESGIQLFATKPTAAPPPLWPWRAPIFLAVCGAISYFGLAALATVLLDAPRTPDPGRCSERLLRFGLAAALPEARDEALIRYRAELERCGNR